MSVPVDTLACYVPALVLRRFARDPTRIGREQESVLGVVLFSDLSGFTALTERLAARGPAGAEDLSGLLNSYFARLIDAVEAHGGDVLKLAGDALVALFRASDDEPIRNAALHAAQCGLAIQRALDGFHPAEGVTLSSKIGIGLGEVVGLHVGGVFDRWELLVAGEPLAQMGRAEHQARPGDVVLAPEAWRRVRRQCRGTPLEEGCVRLDAIDAPLPLWPLSRSTPPSEAAPALLGYVPGAIRSRLDAGQGRWLSELRRITVLFANLPGLYRAGPAELDRIQEVMRAMQESIYRFEGSVNKLSVDEKGVTLIAALGLPPLAHEDDAARGALAALELADRLGELRVPCAIGVTTGPAYCGEIGGATRREYTIIGDVVNLAARLMQSALATGEPGAIRCDAETAHAAAGRLEFEELPEITVKGKERPVRVARPARRVPSPRLAILQEGSSYLVESLEGEDEDRPSSTGRSFVGRAAEIEQLDRMLTHLEGGRGRFVVLEGEAGIGKSRLLGRFIRRARRRGLVVRTGEAEAVERSTAYYAWRPIVARLFGLGPDDDLETRRARVLEGLGPDAELQALAPLLDPILGLDLPETEATAPMTGRVRAENTRDLLVGLLAEAVGRDGPTVLVLEDGHWMDSASWALAAAAVRGEVGALLLVVSMRPMPEGRPAALDDLLVEPSRVVLQLEPLGRDDATALACARLGVDELPRPIRRLIRAKAEGNPLYVEELALMLRDAGLIVPDGASYRLADGVDPESVALPGTLSGLITDRIDRLPPPQQMTLKVASVIGRNFPVRTLRDIFPIEPERPSLPVYLEALERQDLTLRDAFEPDLAYLFKHIITQEVAYELLLFAHRRRLHRRVALWFERSYASELSPYYPLLAHHWCRAEVPDRAIRYLERAGEQALKGGAPQEAVRFIEEAIRLDAATAAAGNGEARAALDRRARWEGLLGRAFLDLGRTAECRSHIVNALRLAGRAVPEGPLPLIAAYLRQIGLQAVRRALPARLAGRGRGDPAELRRVSVAYDLLGQVCYYAQDTAGGVYAALRALNLAEGAGPSPELARSYATMCVAASLVPLHRLADVYGRRARQVADLVGDPAADAWVTELTGVYYLGVGRWAPAREALTRAVALTERLGDWRRFEESLGELGRLDYFRGNYRAGADAFERLGAVARDRGHPQAELWWRNGLSKNLFRMGKVAEAAALLEGSPVLRTLGVDRADAILGLGFLAIVRWRLGRRDDAVHAAEEALSLIEQARPIVNYNLEGYAGAAEVLLNRWEVAVDAGAPVAEARRPALAACAALDRFSGVFPIGRPRAALCRGLARWLDGRRGLARAAWRRALDAAQHLAMPYEHARALYELGRHAPRGGAERVRLLTESGDLFAAIGAVDDEEFARRC